MDMNIELRLSLNYHLTMIFIFRNPLDCIASYLVLAKEKAYKGGKNYFTFINVCRAIYHYNKFFLIMLFCILTGQKQVVIDFDQLTKDTGNCIKHLSDQLGISIGFHNDSVRNYHASSFQRNAVMRHDGQYPTSGFREHYSVIQKMLILTFSSPFYKLLRYLKH